MFRMTVPIRLLRALPAICAVVAWWGALVFFAATVAASADYIQLKVDEKLNRQWRSKVGAMLTEGFKQGDEAVFDEYYKKCVFPEWTLSRSYWTKGRGARVPRYRILKDLERAERGPVYDRLNQLVLKQMLEFAKGNYHPAARVNAMLTIGELNVEKPPFAKPPVALPEALPILLSAVEDEDLLDAARVAALLGIARHSKYGAADAESRRKISDLMLSLVVMRNGPPGRSKAGHAWFRRVAMETLGRFGSPGRDGSVAKAIAGVVSESDAPLSVRCGAAGALGQLRLTPETGLDPAEVGKALEELFVEVIKEEVRLSKEDANYVVDGGRLKARLIAILSAIAGNEEKGSRRTRGIRGLVGKPAEGQPVATLPKEVDAVGNEIEKLLGREYLDHEDLVPKTEKKKPDEKKGSPKYGAVPEGMGGMPGGPEGMGMGPPMGGVGTMGVAGQADPAKPVSEKILAELIRWLKKYEQRQGGG